MEMDKKLLNNYIFTIIHTDSKDKKFICLEGKRLMVGSIFSWESILYQLVQD